MNPSPSSELEFLRAALAAHLDGLLDSGADGLAPCDDVTLTARRARYRELAREVDAEFAQALPAPPDTAANPETGSSASELPAQAPGGGATDTTNPERVDASLGSATDSGHPERAEFDAGGGTIHAPAATSAVAPSEAGADTAASAVSVSDTDARTRLTLLEQRVRVCTRCDLHQTRTQTVFARGSDKSGVCFIGEGPGADEDAQGVPFVGAAGQLLDKMIAGMGLGRDDVYVCNIVKCRPPKNRKPERDEMQACREYLTEQLELVAPRVIVALGATALEGLLGLRGIQRLRGQWRLYQGQIPVMPTFHPAYLLREPSAKRLVWNDLKLVLDHLGLSVPERR